MKKLITSLLLIAFSISLSILKADEYNLLPKPQQMTLKDGVFSLKRAIRLEVPNFVASPLLIKESLEELIVTNGGRIDSRAKVVIRLMREDADIAGAEFQDEAYQLTVSKNEIVVKAKTTIGLYRGVQTLVQLAEDHNHTIRLCDILDWSAWRIRGWMHDCGRSYLPFDQLKEEIKRLAYYKINIFHWHLTDNQGWRLESKVYPQLNKASSYGRHPGKYYTIEEAKELVRLARQYGITVIPEIDMPGHSEAFRKAMGHSMLTPQGLKEMKAIIAEAAQTFEDTEWLHIGTDEVRGPDLGTMDWKVFVPKMTTYIHALGKKVMSWNPGYEHHPSQVDMTQMWSSRGRATKGVPAVDSRYHYINHFDQYADIVGLYKSNICKEQKQSSQYAGVIIGIWNDRNVPSYEDIINQNAFYASMLAMAERAWLGGGRAYFEQGGVMINPEQDQDFVDWERRFLFHKAHRLNNQPIAYVKQTNIKWLISDQYPNQGLISKIFPPEVYKKVEKTYSYNGKTYKSRTAIGAGIYLRHVWGEGVIPAFYPRPQSNATSYAYTAVYSPKAQRVGVQIGFQDYGRSEPDLAPKQGTWDYNGSKIWINGTEIQPPKWLNTHGNKDQEVVLQNENFCVRPLVKVNLHKGWNKVLIKLPNHGFRLGAVRLVKWMFTFAFTTLDGKTALDDVVYDPEMAKESEYDPSENVVSEHVSHGANWYEGANATPVEEISSSVKIYPNPVSDGILCVDLLNSSIGQTYSIYDVKGAILAVGRLDAQSSRLDVKSLAKGLYLLKISGQEDSFPFLVD